MLRKYLTLWFINRGHGLKENHFGDRNGATSNAEIQQDMGLSPTAYAARGVVSRPPCIKSRGSKLVDLLQPISRVAQLAAEEEEDADTNRLFEFVFAELEYDDTDREIVGLKRAARCDFSPSTEM